MGDNIPKHEPNRTCGRCGAKFRCGVEAGDTICWCFELPHVLPVNGTQYNGCLCPECLRELIAAQTSIGDRINGGRA